MCDRLARKSILVYLKSYILITEFDYLIDCKTTGGPYPNKRCVFPFNYNGKVYRGCTDVDNQGTFWCSTKVDKDGNHVDGHWGNCESSCPKGNTP